MIIVPVEKKFDWRHTPLVLFFLVIINVLVFFYFQSNDGEKYYQALEIYYEHDLIEDDWPRYEDWLTQRHRTEELTELRTLYEEGYHDELAVRILMNQEYSRWLTEQPKPQRVTVDDFLDEGFEERYQARKQAQDLIDSTSAIAHGLTANNLKISALITHQFLHGDIFHLLGNLFFLVICGFAVEAALGHLRFTLFYLTCGIGAGLAQAAMDWQSSTPLIGASGAISGVMAMYLGVFRLKKIEFFYWFFFFVGYFRAPALLILPLYIGNELYQYYSSPDSNVAFMAHAGGFVTGAALMLGVVLIRPNLLNREYVEEDQGIDPGQEQLAKVYNAIENFNFKLANEELSRIIQREGLSFELAVLRLNIFKLAGSQQVNKCALEIFKMKTSDTFELAKLEELWQQYQSVEKHMSSDERLSLAMQLVDLPTPLIAKNIFETLKNEGLKNNDMDVLAMKIKNAMQAP